MIVHEKWEIKKLSEELENNQIKNNWPERKTETNDVHPTILRL